MKPVKSHDSQRGYFCYHLYDHMRQHPEIVLISVDLGYIMFNPIRDDMPKQFINTLASEQSALDIAVGLALSGKIPVVYSITPFLIFRAMETIRTYIDHENIPVKLVGGGRDMNYQADGFSHFAHDVRDHMDLFGNIVQFWPVTKELVGINLEYMLFNDRPSFMSLER
jgi:transketolase